MSLEAAISTALSLRDALSQEVQRSRNARSILKAMEIDGLLRQAAERDAFNERSAMFSDQLARALADVAGAHQEKDVTLRQLESWYPFEGAQLASTFAEIRALSAALRELDQFNQTLAEKALTFVRAYVTHLAPRPTAYGRRGTLLSSESSTLSERA